MRRLLQLMPKRVTRRSPERWRDDLSAYVDGELTPRAQARLEAQLAQSEEMRAYLEDLQRMRTVFAGLAPTPRATPFQLTAEMVQGASSSPLRASSTARALRLSMASAAVGVATFGAVMVFDLIDSPSVRFSSTDASAERVSVPTTQVLTDEIESSGQSGSTASAAQPTPVTVAAVAQQEAAAAEQPQAVAAEQPQAAAESAELAESEEQAWQQAEESAQPMTQQSDDAADDPSRQAITAGRSSEASGTSRAQDVTAADVVADVSADEDDAATQLTETSTAEQSSQSESATESVQTERRTVATSVAQVESDWPLEQRPRSTMVQLATDPSWEQPLQFVLAALAISATAVWAVLFVAQRRLWL